MTASEGGAEPDLLIGTPERDSAQEALEEHLVAQRLEPGDYERRLEAAGKARTRSELMRVFADLPVPHPEMPAVAAPPATGEEADDDMPPILLTGCLTLGLGVPVAVVLGFAYGIWWALAVPVAVTVIMTYVEHLRSGSTGSASTS